MASYTQQLQRLVEDYIQAGKSWPTDLRSVAAWAVNSGLWQPQQSAIISQCADQLARALREEYIKDPPRPPSPYQTPRADLSKREAVGLLG